MIINIHQKKRNLLAILSLRIIVALIIHSLIFSPGLSLAQNAPQDNFLNLPVPGEMVSPSVALNPVLIKGMKIFPDQPLKFDFIVDQGTPSVIASETKQSQQEQFKSEAKRLIKYFLAALTIPENDLWVNLSPYEHERMIPQALGETDLGRDLLAQDYILKQLTATLIYPEKELGKEFWARIYKQAQEKFGTTQIPVNTFNKVWILPAEAEVYEKNNAVYVTQAKLKVMLDEDYTALNKTNVNDAHTLASNIVRELIVPEIEKEVNNGKNFALLRQMYYALILAKWYKETIKDSLLAKVYHDKNKIKGIDLDDKNIKEKIYARYLQAYKKGVFNYIKEVPLSLRGGEADEAISTRTTPRKYFSGGILPMQTHLAHTDSAPQGLDQTAAMISVALGQPPAPAMMAETHAQNPAGIKLIQRMIGLSDGILPDQRLSGKILDELGSLGTFSGYRLFVDSFDLKTFLRAGDTIVWKDKFIVWDNHDLSWFHPERINSYIMIQFDDSSNMFVLPYTTQALQEKGLIGKKLIVPKTAVFPQGQRISFSYVQGPIEIATADGQLIHVSQIPASLKAGGDFLVVTNQHEPEPLKEGKALIRSGIRITRVKNIISVSWPKAGKNDRVDAGKTMTVTYMVDRSAAMMARELDITNENYEQVLGDFLLKVGLEDTMAEGVFVFMKIPPDSGRLWLSLRKMGLEQEGQLPERQGRVVLSLIESLTRDAHQLESPRVVLEDEGKVLKVVTASGQDIFFVRKDNALPAGQIMVGSNKDKRYLVEELNDGAALWRKAQGGARRALIASALLENFIVFDQDEQIMSLTKKGKGIFVAHFRKTLGLSGDDTGVIEDRLRTREEFNREEVRAAQEAEEARRAAQDAGGASGAANSLAGVHSLTAEELARHAQAEDAQRQRDAAARQARRAEAKGRQRELELVEIRRAQIAEARGERNRVIAWGLGAVAAGLMLGGLVAYFKPRSHVGEDSLVQSLPPSVPLITSTPVFPGQRGPMKVGPQGNAISPDDINRIMRLTHYPGVNLDMIMTDLQGRPWGKDSRAGPGDSYVMRIIAGFNTPAEFNDALKAAELVGWHPTLVAFLNAKIFDPTYRIQDNGQRTQLIETLLNIFFHAKPIGISPAPFNVFAKLLSESAYKDGLNIEQTEALVGVLQPAPKDAIYDSPAGNFIADMLIKQLAGLESAVSKSTGELSDNIKLRARTIEAIVMLAAGNEPCGAYLKRNNIALLVRYLEYLNSLKAVSVGEMGVLNRLWGATNPGTVAPEVRENVVRIFKGYKSSPTNSPAGSIRKPGMQGPGVNGGLLEIPKLNNATEDAQLADIINRGEYDDGDRFTLINLYNKNPQARKALRAIAKAGGIIIPDFAQVTDGGIDMNQINLQRKGEAIRYHIDEAQLAQFEDPNFGGFSVEITNIKNVSSLLPLFGLQ